jgi:uncharacterized protein (DUF2235 family)
MRHLVVCCDGTWQGLVADSNVCRLSKAFVPRAGDPPAHYVAGVGASGIGLAKLQAGVTGAGVDDAILDGYSWLVETFRTDDRISLFGFSRGAYTARSLAGMIGQVGLVDTTGLNQDERTAAVRRAYARYRALRDTPVDDGWSAGLRFAYVPGGDDIPIDFIGVWDTVGALGIPAYIGVPDLLHSRKQYEFLDVELDPRIPHARHALSLDEMRGPFRPTLWKDPAPGQDMRQVWFPGDHCDVGGGHAEKQLSDVALEWMTGEAATVGLTFDLGRIEGFAPSPQGRAHGFDTGLKGAVLEVGFQPRPRAIPRIDTDVPDARVSESAYERQRRTGYRATVTPAVGDSVTVTVHADRAWTDTGLYLEQGEYKFSATGRWSSAGSSCGPDGDSRMWHLSGGTFSRIVDVIEKGLRTVLNNKEAELVGTRRENGLPWMSLVGRVSNETVVPVAGAQPPQRTTTAEPDDTFPLGVAFTALTHRPGYLYAYPNDALGFYGNNAGAVSLTVTRTG